MPKTKSGKPIPYKEGGSYHFTKESDAKDRAKEINGSYEGFDSDGDGQNDVYVVFQKQTTNDEGITRGAITEYGGSGQGSIDYVGSSTDNAERRLMETGVEDDDKDELGYMQGGMGFTERGPIRYAKGGAVKGKKFSGSY